MKIQLSVVFFIFYIFNIQFVPYVSSQSLGVQFPVSGSHGGNCLKNETCKKIQDCPPILAEARQGRRSADSRRCGFNETIEIVCCPMHPMYPMHQMRPADLACRQYENKIFRHFAVIQLRIMNGMVVSRGEFPFIAALGYKTKKYYCGGTIISERFILTAAHCAGNIDRRTPLLVRLGSLRLDTLDNDVQEIYISKIILHPDYKYSKVYHDIALLKLSRPIKWSSTVKPICLQTKPVNIINSKVSLIVAGWGVTEIGEETSSNELMKTPSLEIVNRSICEIHYRNKRELPYGINDSMICAIDANKIRRSDACQGDSGGPFIMQTSDNDTLIGITSFGQGCGGPAPGLYTSIYTYLEWIESHVWPESGRN